ncbi:MAG: hypothetical protein RLZZ393_1566 [Pseudomonadota bacterium]|jgi:uncharacterized protein YqiB (DUF1249 family)
MMIDALIPVSWRSRPRSFVALMSMYESSFLRLRSLCGDPARLSGDHVSRVEGDCDLVLTITDQTPYTTGLQLTYLWPGEDEAALLRFPDVEIRVYADARMAEARRWAPEARHPALQDLRRGMGRELHERWGMNIMLNKWLEYCLERGHRFG